MTASFPLLVLEWYLTLEHIELLSASDIEFLLKQHDSKPLFEEKMPGRQRQPLIVHYDRQPIVA